MKIYSENKLRKRISILRMGKMLNQLNDIGLVELATCELLLENFWDMQDLKEMQEINEEIEIEDLIRNIKL